MSQELLTYKDTGVDYEAMDPFKRKCQMRAYKTRHNADRLCIHGMERSRGESVYVLNTSKALPFIGHVEEGLGTKNLVADAMHKATGKSYYDQIAQCTVAMIVNDMSTLGLLPASIAMHLAVGSSHWFDDEQRCEDLVSGWGNACDLAGAVWAGGETPTLQDIILPEASLLSGSGLGVTKKPMGHPKDSAGLLRCDAVEEGDAIIFLTSNGIHANGLTLARRIASKLPEGYETPLMTRTYGETLLDPTHIYCRVSEACHDAGIDLHYAVNVTGHGFRKLMRAPQALSYVVDQLPETPLIFDFIKEHGPMSDEEAYGTLNMGAGYALFVPDAEADMTVDTINSSCLKFPFRALKGGNVEKSNVKRVVIRPKNLEYKGDTLAIR